MVDQRVTARQRRLVAQRAGGCCEYCRSQERYSPDPFSIEHIVPIARGGSHELANLAFACLGCNNHKYTSIQGIDPVNGEGVALYHPRRQHWEDHFSWSEDFTLMVGRTPTGRATIGKLYLNRAGVVNFRRVLAALGRHPPDV
jgi:hypothetical protein